MKMPMIAMITSSSTKVKPQSLPNLNVLAQVFSVCLYPALGRKKKVSFNRPIIAITTSVSATHIASSLKLFGNPQYLRVYFQRLHAHLICWKPLLKKTLLLFMAALLLASLLWIDSHIYMTLLSIFIFQIFD